MRYFLSHRLIRHSRLLLIGFLMALLSGMSTARSQQVIADISEHLIEIRSNFTGTDLLLFGAIDWSKTNFRRSRIPNEPSFDVIIILRGPSSDMLIRRKDRVAGIWVNNVSVTVGKAPNFYTILATRPVADILPAKTLEAEEFALNNLKFEWPTGLNNADRQEFREALLYNLQRDNLYVQKNGTIEILHDTLFRAKVNFPATVPVGAYRAEIYLVRNGKIIGRQTSPLAIGKSGFERAVYDFAHEQSALYGLTAVLIALFAGLVASEVSRRLG
jgi:uncharacterized protein (TIGR02186 family)